MSLSARNITSANRPEIRGISPWPPKRSPWQVAQLIPLSARSTSALPRATLPGGTNSTKPEWPSRRSAKFVVLGHGDDPLAQRLGAALLGPVAHGAEPEPGRRRGLRFHDPGPDNRLELGEIFGRGAQIRSAEMPVAIGAIDAARGPVRAPLAKACICAIV